MARVGGWEARIGMSGRSTYPFPSVTYEQPHEAKPSRVIRPVDRCALPNFERPRPAPYCRCRCGKLTEPKTLGCHS